MSAQGRVKEGESRRGPLKLRARDAEDLEAIAACLQDALVPLSEIAYLRAEKRFVLVASRFCWESAARVPPPAAPPEPGRDAAFEDSDEAAGPLFERVNCGLCFDRVRAVRRRGLDLAHKDRIMNLLTLRPERGAVILVFSGGAEIRLEVSEIRCHLEDLGEPWPTRWRPSHPEEAAAGGRD